MTELIKKVTDLVTQLESAKEELFTAYLSEVESKFMKSDYSDVESFENRYGEKCDQIYMALDENSTSLDDWFNTDLWYNFAIRTDKEKELSHLTKQERELYDILGDVGEDKIEKLISYIEQREG
jgi:hypothetical protein